MNYKKIYDALVEKARVRGLDKSQHEGYFEIHHINPRCLGGGDDPENLVMLTAREHYVAHLILAKLNPEVEGLTYAAFMMSSESNNNSWNYKYLREKVSKLNYNRNFGRLKVDWTGHKFGRLTVLQYLPNYQMKNGRRTPKWECLCDCGQTTYLATPYIARERILSCGCLLSETSRSRLLGVDKSPHVRDKISKTLRDRNLKPWEYPSLVGKDLDKWKLADSLYTLWISEGHPKSMNFTKAYNKVYNTSHSRSYFKTIVKLFIEGWVPLEDEGWLNFSKGS